MCAAGHAHVLSCVECRGMLSSLTLYSVYSDLGQVADPWARSVDSSFSVSLCWSYTLALVAILGFYEGMWGVCTLVSI